MDLIAQFVVFLLPSAVIPNVIRNGTQSVTFCNPKASPPCIDEKFGFCISDDDYPMDDIQVFALVLIANVVITLL